MNVIGRRLSKLANPPLWVSVPAIVVGSWVFYGKNLAPLPPLATGEDLSAIEMVDGSGEYLSLATGQPTMMLLFNSKCGACRATAPLWKEWLEGSTLNAVAVSDEALEISEGFAREYELDVDVRQMTWRRTDRSSAMYGPGFPQAVLLDGAGRVLGFAHGSKVDSLASLVEAPTNY